MNNDKSGKAGRTVAVAVAAAVVLMVVGMLAGYELHGCLNVPVFARTTEAGTGTSQHQCHSATACNDDGACPYGRTSRTTNRCSDYGACSLYGDLSGASGDTLEMYYREKAQDGRRFADFPLPDFNASTPKGDAIRSRDLRGDPVVLAFLAVHCRHSMRTLPILQELVRTRGDRGLRVVGVWVNSGSVEDLNTWLHVFEPEFEVWSYPSASLGDVVQSHLVPTILFVDRDGKVREKMVGEKTLEDISARADALLAS